MRFLSMDRSKEREDKEPGKEEDDAIDHESSFLYPPLFTKGGEGELLFCRTISMTYSLSLRSWFTRAGLAFPLEAFMTCPTRNPKTFSWPLRYDST